MHSAPNGGPIAVLGAGSWGTALALLLSRNGLEVRLWGHDPQHVAALARDRCNDRYLPGTRFPQRLRPLASMEAALHKCQLVLLVVPSHAFAQTLEGAAPALPEGVPVAWATKGLDERGGRLLHEVVAQRLDPERALAVISGPTFAAEVAAGLPTAMTVAANRADVARSLAACLHGDRVRAYYTDDLIGVQLGGAVKNVLAIAAGIADGLGFGANSRSALITRGMAEIMRLGEAVGGRRETLMGLAGLGDLVLTCTDNLSRNRRMGLALAQGRSIEAARHEIAQEVEGVRTARAVRCLADRLAVEMPITEQVCRVLYEGMAPQAAVAQLLSREQKSEQS